MKDNNVYLKMTKEATNRINVMEDKVAKELYGCTWDELDEDERTEVTYEAYDRLNGGISKWLKYILESLISFPATF